MEGRTIARPDKLQRPRPRCGRSSFNGGPDNCPARPARGRVPGGVPGQTPRSAPGASPFNGGPDNCPARPTGRPPCGFSADLRHLQWRAGQLPGQTWSSGQVGASRPCSPSMEGRTIARPDVPAGPIQAANRLAEPFNGGPDNCPARHRVGVGTMSARSRVLQWRAGQLPGQTSQALRPDGGLDGASLQWRAGQLPGQTDVGVERARR